MFFMFKYCTSLRRRNPSYYGNCFICKKEDLDNHIKADYSKQKFTKVMFYSKLFE